MAKVMAFTGFGSGREEKSPLCFQKLPAEVHLAGW
jgi:hypothetical protein